MPAPSTLALFAVAALALIASSSAAFNARFRHGRQVTGAVNLALGAAAALTGGRR